MPIQYTETHLENMFKDYGTVISTRILRNPDGVSKGVGFARMESKEKCEQIVQAFNGKLIPGVYLIYMIDWLLLFNVKWVVFPRPDQVYTQQIL